MVRYVARHLVGQRLNRVRRSQTGRETVEPVQNESFGVELVVQMQRDVDEG